MNKKQYLDKRDQLMNQANQKISEGLVDEANQIMDQVKELDETFENEAQARADFEALKEPKGIEPMNVGSFVAGTVNSEMNPLDAWASNEYYTAWAHSMMGAPMTAEEKEVYAMVNEAYTHTTGNTSQVIPKNVSTRIWEEAAELYPYYAEVTKTYVNGLLSIPQEETSSDSGWVEETKTTEDGKEAFKEFILAGCELARDIVVSWKLKEMSMDDFVRYIERKMGEKMGQGADYGVLKGAGKSANEPTGVITALLAEENKPQVVEYSTLSYSDFTKARGKIKSGYSAGLKVYANNSTIWNQIANVLDANKRPIFVPDPTTGKYRVLGMEVEEDATLEEDEILISNAKRGYHANVNKEISLLTQEENKKRATTYTGYAILDGNVLTTKAHALLKKKASQQ